MGFGETYENLVKKIIKRLQISVPDLRDVTYCFVGPGQIIKSSPDDVAYKRVNIGVKKIEDIIPPEAFVIPRDDNIAIAATSTQEHTMSFEIIAITENPATQAGLFSAIALGWKIYDAFLSDREILKSCHDLHIPRVSPQVIDGDEKKFLHQVNIFLDCKYLTTAG